MRELQGSIGNTPGMVRTVLDASRINCANLTQA
jgi:hypothetical protein